MPKNVWEVLWYMSSLLVHASDLWPQLLGVKNVISCMADADDLSGLMITTFHFYSMCTYFYGDNTCGLLRSSSALHGTGGYLLCKTRRKRIVSCSARLPCVYTPYNNYVWRLVECFLFALLGYVRCSFVCLKQ